MQKIKSIPRNYKIDKKFQLWDDEHDNKKTVKESMLSDSFKMEQRRNKFGKYDTTKVCLRLKKEINKNKISVKEWINCPAIEFAVNSEFKIIGCNGYIIPRYCVRIRNMSTTLNNPGVISKPWKIEDLRSLLLITKIIRLKNGSKNIKAWHYNKLA